MNERIRKEVNNLFQNAPNTKRANDLKDEIISNAEDKYEDLIKQGTNEEEALQIVIKEIGNVDELIEELNKNNPIHTQYVEEARKKTGLIVSICVGLYILSVIACVVLDELGLPDFITASSFLSIAGVSTCVLIYHFMTKPKYTKYDDTIVEEFKEWKGKNDKNKEIKKAIDSIIWTLTVIIYLVVSFTFGIWYISWIIFLIASLIENIIKLIFKLGEE
ncbi:MAG: hypothetical protein HFJ19_02160 [Clostridia bacterium]|nr:hypothetical protein [Clostridia bacterium]